MSGPGVTAAFASQSQALKGVRHWEDLAKASDGRKVGERTEERIGVQSPVQRKWGMGEGVSHKASYRGAKGQEYVQKGWQPLLPTLQ